MNLKGRSRAASGPGTRATTTCMEFAAQRCDRLLLHAISICSVNLLCWLPETQHELHTATACPVACTTRGLLCRYRAHVPQTHAQFAAAQCFTSTTIHVSGSICKHTSAPRASDYKAMRDGRGLGKGKGWGGISCQAALSAYTVFCDAHRRQ